MGSQYWINGLFLLFVNPPKRYQKSRKEKHHFRQIAILNEERARELILRRMKKRK